MAKSSGFLQCSNFLNVSVEAWKSLFSNYSCSRTVACWWCCSGEFHVCLGQVRRRRWQHAWPDGGNEPGSIPDTYSIYNTLNDKCHCFMEKNQFVFWDLCRVFSLIFTLNIRMLWSTVMIQSHVFWIFKSAQVGKKQSNDQCQDLNKHLECDTVHNKAKTQQQ